MQFAASAGRSVHSSRGCVALCAKQRQRCMGVAGGEGRIDGAATWEAAREWQQLQRLRRALWRAGSVPRRPGAPQLDVLRWGAASGQQRRSGGGASAAERSRIAASPGSRSLAAALFGAAFPLVQRLCRPAQPTCCHALCPALLCPNQVPPALNRFTRTLDKNMAESLFKLLLKYRPEVRCTAPPCDATRFATLSPTQSVAVASCLCHAACLARSCLIASLPPCCPGHCLQDKAAKKERLMAAATAREAGQEVEKKKPVGGREGVLVVWVGAAGVQVPGATCAVGSPEGAALPCCAGRLFACLRAMLRAGAAASTAASRVAQAGAARSLARSLYTLALSNTTANLAWYSLRGTAGCCQVRHQPHHAAD